MVNQRGARRGLSLAETVVSLFIITGCLLVVIKMVLYGADVQRRTVLNEKAALIAARHLGKIRTWARTPGNFFNAGGWTTQATGVAFSEPDHPEFTVLIQSQQESLYSPCTESEVRYAGTPDDRKVLEQSYRKVQIRVSWNPPNSRNQLEIVTVVGAPEQPVETVTLTPTETGPLAQKAFSNVTVTARDASGNVVPDQFFSWKQQPQPGVPGSAGRFSKVPRKGLEGEYQHFYRTVTIGGTQKEIFGPEGNVTISVHGRSPSIFDSSTTRWVVNSTGNTSIANGP